MAKKKANRKLYEAHSVQYTHQASRVKLWGSWLFRSFTDKAGKANLNVTYGFSNFKYSTASDKQEFHDQRVLRLQVLLTYSMVQSPSWGANWFAASQETPRIL